MYTYVYIRMYTCIFKEAYTYTHMHTEYTYATHHTQTPTPTHIRFYSLPLPLPPPPSALSSSPSPTTHLGHSPRTPHRFYQDAHLPGKRRRRRMRGGGRGERSYHSTLSISFGEHVHTHKHTQKYIHVLIHIYLENMFSSAIRFLGTPHYQFCYHNHRQIFQTRQRF